MYIPSEAPHNRVIRSIIEVLTEYIPGIAYGQEVELEIPDEKLKIIRNA